MVCSKESSKPVTMPLTNFYAASALARMCGTIGCDGEHWWAVWRPTHAGLLAQGCITHALFVMDASYASALWVDVQ
jgi:hypothetical protein